MNKYIAVLLLVAAVAGGFWYFSATKSSENGQLSATPSVTRTIVPTTEIVTQTPTPTVTATVTVTTPVPTPTSTKVTLPTISTTAKKVKISAQNIPSVTEFYIELPASVTTSVDKHNIYLKSGSKTFMWLTNNLTPVPETPVSYSAIASVTAVSAPGLKRITSKTNLGNDFYVGYTSQVWKNSDCTAESQVGPVPAPCATNIVISVNNQGAFKAMCSVKAEYIVLCDQIMKTLQVKDLTPVW